ncbi:ORF6N domain-containing protein [Paenibacillus albiflavus]|uniref:ORF6N domain-containing protein n=1 Tax=Paenibacillus albiflavus TaxID=2545760 RepID=UPI0038B30B0B
MNKYVEAGKHYFKLEGESERDFINHHEFHDGYKNTSVLYLWTEKGAWMHAKSLNTDQA